MGLIAKESGGGGNFKPVPPGMHLARCYRIVDLGTQTSSYQGTPKTLQKVMLQFEVHGEDEQGNQILTEKGEPMSISKNFTLSLGEMATLRKDLQTWRGREFNADELRGFELKNVLGAWAMLSVIMEAGSDGKTYTNIAAIMAVHISIKKAGLPQGFNDLKLFSIDEPDMALYDSFSNNLKEKIAKSPEWQGRTYQKEQIATANSSGFDDMDSEIPF